MSPPFFLFEPSSACQGASSSSSSFSGSYGVSVSSPCPARPLETHPFYRFPNVPAHMVVNEVKWNRGSAPLNCHKQLNVLRVLFKKETLSPLEANVLFFETSRLLSYARFHMDKELSGMTSSRALDAAGLMLVVVDALYAAGCALGPSSAFVKWWPALMRTIPSKVFVRSNSRCMEKVDENLRLIHDIQVALETFKAGTRPPARHLVALKTKLFCAPIMRFRRKSWNAWRDDDKEWQNSK